MDKMTFAIGKQCNISVLTSAPRNGHTGRGGCGGRLHGHCGEMEDPDGDNIMDRICHACIDAKPTTGDGSTVPADKHKRADKEGRGAGSSMSTKPGAEQATGQRASRAEVTLGRELELLQLLDQGVAHIIADR